MNNLINRIRPTAIIIVVIMSMLAGYIIYVNADYTETIIGVIVGALAGSLDKILKGTDG